MLDQGISMAGLVMRRDSGEMVGIGDGTEQEVEFERVETMGKHMTRGSKRRGLVVLGTKRAFRHSYPEIPLVSSFPLSINPSSSSITPTI